MAISATQVKELRDKTGAGMMDCKKALTEADGNFEKAIEILRKKGASVAAKRAEKAVNEGVVATRVTDNTRAIILEVNCETDFVANTDGFRAFAKNVAMHIAASSPVAVTREEVDQNLIEKELEIFKEQAKAQGKPDNIVEKIAQGRIEKYYVESVLIDQAYVKEPDKSIKDLLNED